MARCMFSVLGLYPYLICYLQNHMTLTGPVVLDIVQHFVERWNEIKKRKYRSDE